MVSIAPVREQFRTPAFFNTMGTSDVGSRKSFRTPKMMFFWGVHRTPTNLSFKLDQIGKYFSTIACKK